MIEDKFKKIEIENEKLNVLIDNYLDQIEASPNTIRSRKYALELFSNFHKTRKSFYFLVEDINKYRRYIERTLLKNPLTVRNYMSALNGFCKYLIDISVLEKNPVSRITYKIKDLKPKVKAISLSKMLDVLLNSKESKYSTAVMILMIYSSNLELKDLVGIKKDVFQINQRSYTILNSDYSFKIDNRFNYLIKYLLNNTDEYLFINKVKKDGAYLSKRGIEESIKKLLKRNGITDNPIASLKQSSILYYYYRNKSVSKLRDVFNIKSDSIIKKHLEQFPYFRSS